MQNLLPTLPDWLLGQWRYITMDSMRVVILCVLVLVVAWAIATMIHIHRHEQQQKRRGVAMTRKERERYLRTEVPAIILDALEDAFERNRITRTEVNRLCRELGGIYKMPDLKTQRRLGMAEVIRPTKANRPSMSHLQMVKTGILFRTQQKFKQLLFRSPPIPGPKPGEGMKVKRPKGPRLGKVKTATI